MPPILIATCICRQMPFATLLPLAREHGWTLQDVMRETGCGDGCGLCRPYLRRMLTTGETQFTELINE
jgi:bacterioferritin-associated ferredoxin